MLAAAPDHFLAMPRPRSLARASTPADADGTDAPPAPPTPRPPGRLRGHPLAAAVGALLLATLVVGLGVAALYAIGEEDAVGIAGMLLSLVGGGVRFVFGLLLVLFAGVEFVRHRRRIVAADQVYVAPAFAAALGLGLVGGTGGGLAAIALAILAGVLIWQRAAVTRNATGGAGAEAETGAPGSVHCETAEDERGDSPGAERPAARDDVPN